MLVAQSCPTQCDLMDCNPPGSSCPWDSPGKNTGMDNHSLLQRIFLTQGPNPGLLHRQVDSLLSESPDSKAQITYVENSLYIYGLSIFKEF